MNVDRTIDKGTGAPPDGKSIYPFISKNYDMSIFDKFPFLAKSLLITGEENEIKKEKPKIIIDSKKYDWDAKKI